MLKRQDFTEDFPIGDCFSSLVLIYPQFRCRKDADKDLLNSMIYFMTEQIDLHQPASNVCYCGYDFL